MPEKKNMRECCTDDLRDKECNENNEKKNKVNRMNDIPGEIKQMKKERANHGRS